MMGSKRLGLRVIAHQYIINGQHIVAGNAAIFFAFKQINDARKGLCNLTARSSW
jgi:hypothetical protein